MRTCDYCGSTFATVQNAKFCRAKACQNERQRLAKAAKRAREKAHRKPVKEAEYNESLANDEHPKRGVLSEFWRTRMMEFVAARQKLRGGRSSRSKIKNLES